MLGVKILAEWLTYWELSFCERNIKFFIKYIFDTQFIIISNNPFVENIVIECCSLFFELGKIL